MRPGSTEAVAPSGNGSAQPAPGKAVDGDKIEEIVRRVLAELGK